MIALAKKYINLLLIILILLSLINTVVKNKNQYLVGFNYNKLNSLYKTSQFAQDVNDRENIIQDEDLYAFSGYYYLTTGDISSINIEHPPLGKYFIGLSAVIFNNQNIGQIFWAVIFLIFLFLISQKILKNTSLALLVVLLFIQERLFIEQITLSLLDLILAVFLLIFWLITLLKHKNKAWLIVQGVSLGTIASIKYPTIAVMVFATWFIYKILIKTNAKKIKTEALYLIFLTTIVFLLSHLPFFIKNPNFLSFINLQEKALRIHLSHVPEYPKAQVFRVLFFNQWLAWWGEKNYIRTEFWNLFWPTTTLIFLASLIKIKNNLLIKLWSLVYLTFLSLRLFFPRYLFLLLPFFYLNLCYNFQRVYKLIKSFKNR
jgi:predicted membrane-bound dolichyl-phosphate-mannose-protein mannosyltransferase